MVRRKPPSATRIGVGTVALAIGRGLRALRGALGTIEVFRPLRRGYFAPCEARPEALPPGPLQLFEKS